jgi:hypothetical protein
MDVMEHISSNDSAHVSALGASAAADPTCGAAAEFLIAPAL